MKKDYPKLTKASLRLHFRNIHSTISIRHRCESFLQFLSLFNIQGMMASFASFGDEIDLWPLNAMLANEKRLLLPKTCEDELVFVW